MNQIVTCRTCRHWKLEERQAGLGICRHEKLGDLGVVRGRGPDVLAYEWDEGGAILTGPEFGCIHHEERT